MTVPMPRLQTLPTFRRQCCAFATRTWIRENRSQMEGETSGPDTGGVSCLAPMSDTRHDYRRLHSVLVSRARWLGSRDGESAAQEALARSLRNPISQVAIEYYFSEQLPPDCPVPEWPLDQLLAWLHGVLTFVVRGAQSSQQPPRGAAQRFGFRGILQTHGCIGSRRSGSGPTRYADSEGDAANRGGMPSRLGAGI